MDVRRIVTGLDENGKSTAWIDGEAANATSRRPGHDSRLIWVTDRSPAPYLGDEDAGAREVGRPPPETGSIFRVIEIGPGCTAEMHKTKTVDYVVVISGEMDMELETGRLPLRPGDVIVQRGTLHNWINDNDAPCVIAVVLLDGVPEE